MEGLSRSFSLATMSFISMGDVDLLHPPRELEQRRHKLKRLVQSPNSFFMDVKCPGCFNITTVFSHAQTVVLCGSCSTVLCQPTGGKARLVGVLAVAGVGGVVGGAVLCQPTGGKERLVAAQVPVFVE